MLVSILHRVTGSGLATVGSLLLVWWLAALAGGAESYATFTGVFTTQAGRLNILGIVVAVGLTLSLFQHMMSGIRHLFLDTGAGFELRTNKTYAMLTMVASVALTAVFWLYMGIK
jgi:succinate dehydrogenase / fumarate reductase cytochrome b subunit